MNKKKYQRFSDKQREGQRQGIEEHTSVQRIADRRYMKTRPVSMFALITLLIGCSTIKQQKNDLMEMNLNGKVKSIRVFMYEAIEKSGEISKGKRAGNWTDNKFITFSVNGNKIEEISYNSDGSIYMKVTYRHDAKRNRIRENSYDEDGNLTGKFSYKYDDKGNLIENDSYNEDGRIIEKFVYKYDDKGNQIEASIYFSDSSLDTKSTYKYDDKGNAIEMNSYNYKGNLSTKHDYKYDDKGSTIEENSHNANGDLISKHSYKYDDKGNLIEHNSYKSDSSINIKLTYKFEFDKKNNWIQQIQFKNNLPIYILERKIKYYD